jgi:hypothetical protein
LFINKLIIFVNKLIIMKTLGNKSLSAILAKCINVIWWIAWIGFVVLITAIIMTAVIKKAFVLNIPVTYAAVTIAQIQPAGGGFPPGVLNSTNGSLYVQIAATWPYVIMLLAALTIIFAAVLMVTYQLKIIFSNFRNNLPFNEPNISRIRHIAVVLIGYALAQWLFNIAVNQILVSNFRWEHITLTYSFNISCLLTGIVLIVIAEIFKQGTALDNENKLTI